MHTHCASNGSCDNTPTPATTVMCTQRRLATQHVRSPSTMPRLAGGVPHPRGVRPRRQGSEPCGTSPGPAGTHTNLAAGESACTWADTTSDWWPAVCPLTNHSHRPGPGCTSRVSAVPATPVAVAIQGATADGARQRVLRLERRDIMRQGRTLPAACGAFVEGSPRLRLARLGAVATRQILCCGC